MTILSPRQQVFAFRAVMFTLVLAAVVTFVPLWAPLVLAAWVAVMTRPLLTRIQKITGGRDRAAGAIVLAMVMVILVPLGVALLSLMREAADLGKGLLASNGAKNALITVVSGGAQAPGSGPLDVLASPQKIIALVQEHGAQAASIASGVAGAGRCARLSRRSSTCSAQDARGVCCPTAFRHGGRFTAGSPGCAMTARSSA